MAKGRKDRYADFRALTKAGQAEAILNTASMCIDGAPTYLARWVEIYLDATEAEQVERRTKIHAAPLDSAPPL